MDFKFLFEGIILFITDSGKQWQDHFYLKNRKKLNKDILTSTSAARLYSQLVLMD